MNVNPIFVKLIKHSAKNKNHPISTKNNNRKEKYILEPNYLSGDKLSIWGYVYICGNLSAMYKEYRLIMVKKIFSFITKYKNKSLHITGRKQRSNHYRKI